jgi:NhaP-type Na+/H+ or K+/H+ antiporter
MGMFDFWFWPFGAALIGIGLLLALLVFVFWVWMIIDCAQRKFKNDLEKIIWILVIVFGSWVGALVYFIVIRQINPKGLAKTK